MNVQCNLFQTKMGTCWQSLAADSHHLHSYSNMGRFSSFQISARWLSDSPEHLCHPRGLTTNVIQEGSLLCILHTCVTSDRMSGKCHTIILPWQSVNILGCMKTGKGLVNIRGNHCSCSSLTLRFWPDWWGLSWLQYWLTSQSVDTRIE